MDNSHCLQFPLLRSHARGIEVTRRPTLFDARHHYHVPQRHIDPVFFLPAMAASVTPAPSSSSEAASATTSTTSTTYIAAATSLGLA